MTAGRAGRGWGAGTEVPPLANHRLDEARLAAYLEGALPGFAGPLVGAAVPGWDSPTRPTTSIRPGAEYVLRKKPPGTLLPSAHAVDREYAVQSALAGSAVPVAPMRLLCRDETVIGTMFYVMDHVPGRVFADRTLRGVPPADRAAMYDDMNRVMAALHGVDWQAAGLAGLWPAAGLRRPADRPLDPAICRLRRGRRAGYGPADRVAARPCARPRTRPPSPMATSGSAT